MSKKFNPKIYQEGKNHLYVQVSGATSIRRFYKWNGGEYVPGTYQARRYDDMKKRVKCSFNSLAEARAWQAGKDVTGTPKEIGMNFGEVINEWKKRMFPTFRDNTKTHYEKMVRLYISKLACFGIYEITPSKVDEWIDELKSKMAFSIQHKNRKSFDHELSVLSTILKYYENYNDDQKYRYPVKKRHKEAVKLAIRTKVPNKDLTEDQFKLFLDSLRKQKNGNVYADLAIIQYYQALRISEAVAIHWEDIQMSPKKPSKSRLQIVRSAHWPRKAGMRSGVHFGFKNSEAMGGVKEHPIFPETYRVLERLNSACGANPKGLVLTIDSELLEYRSIHHYYNRAFELAGLTQYKATHIMRHGGTRRLYNENGDLSIAQQVLGNTDIESVMVYAKRSARALTQVSDRHWALLGPETSEED